MKFLTPQLVHHIFFSRPDVALKGYVKFEKKTPSKMKTLASTYLVWSSVFSGDLN